VPWEPVSAGSHWNTSATSSLSKSARRSSRPASSSSTGAKRPAHSRAPAAEPLHPTAEPPDRALLRTTVAAALAAQRPFVVTFSTPLYCQTRTCGPVVQVVQAVQRDWRGRDVDFVHVEIYKDNDPAKGVNRWVTQWKLPSEPWVFLVGPDGTIRDRFEGTVSVRELDASIRQHLLR